MTHPQRLSPPRTDGFALVLSLLFTGIVLLIVVSTAASLVTGSRQGGVNERQAYQALMVAESGLNSLSRRLGEYLRTKPYVGTTSTELKTWLDGFQSSDLAKPEAVLVGNTMLLKALSGSTFTAESTGKTTQSTKVIVQDYFLEERHLPPGVRPDSGLTSIPAITAGSSSTVLPASVTSVIKTVGDSAIGTAQTTIKVSSVNGLLAGDYVKINDTTLRIDGVAVSTNTLTVTRVLPNVTTTTTINDKSQVNLIPNAVATTPATISSSMTVKASNVADFTPPETVSVKIGTTTYVASVSSKDASVKTITLSWTPSTAVPPSLPEGTAITRNTLAMSSSSSVTLDQKSKLDSFQSIQNGTVQNDCTSKTSCAGTNTVSPTLTSSQFTQMLLGLTDAQLNDLVPLTTTAPDPPFGTTANVGILRVTTEAYNSIIKSNGIYTGVIIIDDPVSANLNGTTLNGLLYLRGGMTGDKKFNGSMVVNGAIAVYGDSSSQTSVLQGNVTINYNPVQLRFDLASSVGSKQVVTTSGTWRQQ